MSQSQKAAKLMDMSEEPQETAAGDMTKQKKDKGDDSAKQSRKKDQKRKRDDIAEASNVPEKSSVRSDAGRRQMQGSS